jgi:hypothetical protein
MQGQNQNPSRLDTTRVPQAKQAQFFRALTQRIALLEGKINELEAKLLSIEAGAEKPKLFSKRLRPEKK